MDLKGITEPFNIAAQHRSLFMEMRRNLNALI
jgi:hypothetical protein